MNIRKNTACLLGTLFLLIIIPLTGCADKNKNIAVSIKQAIFYIEEGSDKKALSELNKALTLSGTEDALPVNQVTMSLLQANKCSALDVRLSALTIEDISYIRRAFFYKKTAVAIVKGLKSNREKVMALFNWTCENVQSPPAGKDTAALPIDIIKRGYGGCDRSAWVLVALAQQLGYPAHIFYMINPETNTSPHTIAQIFLDGKWVLFDTYKSLVFWDKQNENLIGINEAIDYPDLLDKDPAYKNELKRYFSQGIVWVVTEAQGSFPKMKIVERMLKNYFQGAPNLYHDVFKEMFFTAHTLSGKNISTLTPGLKTSKAVLYKVEGRTYLLGLWFYPFNLRLKELQR